MRGYKEVDTHMIPVADTIRKYVKNKDAFTDIYNRAYMAIVNSLAENGLQTCNWIEDKDEIMFWTTDCGRSFYLNVQYPSILSLEYCSYCGRKMVEHPNLDPAPRVVYDFNNPKKPKKCSFTQNPLKGDDVEK